MPPKNEHPSFAYERTNAEYFSLLKISMFANAERFDLNINILVRGKNPKFLRGKTS